jgi:hypothetical protein
MSCTSCGLRVVRRVAAQPLATQRPRATITTQPTIALATRSTIGAPPRTMAPASWVREAAVASEDVEIESPAPVYAPPAPPPPPVNAPPPAMPPPVAMPPPIAIQQPVFYAPPPRTGVRKIRKRNGFGIGARVVAIGFGLLILFGIIGAIDNAVSSNSTSKISPISIPSIRITFPNLVPHQPPPHKTAKTPPHAVNVNALSDLITLSVSNELYRAEHGSYTNRVSALSSSSRSTRRATTKSASAAAGIAWSVATRSRAGGSTTASTRPASRARTARRPKRCLRAHSTSDGADRARHRR